MQIFRPCYSWVESAMALDDLRLGKQILECAQILSTATHAQFPGWDDLNMLYKPTHARHPLTIWAGSSRENFRQCLQAYAIFSIEWQDRREKWHGASHLHFILDRAADLFQCGEYKEQPNCTSFKDMPLPDAYRRCLAEKWDADTVSGRPPKWTGHNRPDWYK